MYKLVCIFMKFSSRYTLKLLQSYCNKYLEHNSFLCTKGIMGDLRPEGEMSQPEGWISHDWA